MTCMRPDVKNESLKRIIEIPIELMINKSDAHDEMFYGKIMHDEYMIFVNKHINAKVDYLVEQFLNVRETGRNLLFNMHYMNKNIPLNLTNYLIHILLMF